ncbi:MAG: hypothetical protein CVU12_05560 [Bacteroidetes bacterium HGW-Bacteroidetes-7]|jgi:hypothetical protein|nr:MAG: hypothetical protein CVU12_05560 [Bacteroidetes bacterium HGW-Bacteroidetes-7]
MNNKHIGIAASIYILGILSGIGIARVFTLSYGFYDILSSIIIVTLSFPFSYFLYYLSKSDAEIRRLNDIKLMTYNSLADQSNSILKDCSILLLNLCPELSKEEKVNVTHLSIALPLKFNRITKDIQNFNTLLSTNICVEHIDNIQNVINPMIISLDKLEFKSKDECSEIYSVFHTNVNEFTDNLCKELLKQ